MTLIAIHILQNHAPSNLNRDENGDPKDCLFGGVRRARISSQSLKRSIRYSDVLRDDSTLSPLLAQRSQLSTHVRNYLEASDRLKTLSKETQSAIWRQAANLAMASKKGKDTESDEADSETDASSDAESVKGQLVFLTPEEVKQVAERLLELSEQTFSVQKGDKKSKKGDNEPVPFAKLTADQLREQIGKFEPHSVDIAMFGRMTTSSPFKDIEAAVQVAHAISTHEVDQEFDFFTAVDDLESNSGAGLLGETAFNSATYYKYINVHWESLVSNLGGDEQLASQTVAALLRAAALSIPSGKQNSFAAHNLPDLVLVEVREQNISLSYANAFVKPIRPTRDRSLMESSADALSEYIPAINKMYGLKVKQAFITTLDNLKIEGAQRCKSFDDLLKVLFPATEES